MTEQPLSKRQKITRIMQLGIIISIQNSYVAIAYDINGKRVYEERQKILTDFDAMEKINRRPSLSKSLRFNGFAKTLVLTTVEILNFIDQNINNNVKRKSICAILANVIDDLQNTMITPEIPSHIVDTAVNLSKFKKDLLSHSSIQYPYDPTSFVIYRTNELFKTDPDNIGSFWFLGNDPRVAVPSLKTFKYLIPPQPNQNFDEITISHERIIKLLDANIDTLQTIALEKIRICNGFIEAGVYPFDVDAANFHLIPSMKQYSSDNENDYGISALINDDVFIALKNANRFRFIHTERLKYYCFLWTSQKLFVWSIFNLVLTMPRICSFEFDYQAENAISIKRDPETPDRWGIIYDIHMESVLPENEGLVQKVRNHVSNNNIKRTLCKKFLVRVARLIANQLTDKQNAILNCIFNSCILEQLVAFPQKAIWFSDLIKYVKDKTTLKQKTVTLDNLLFRSDNQSLSKMSFSAADFNNRVIERLSTFI